MKNNQKGFFFLVPLFIIAALVVGGGAIYYKTQVNNKVEVTRNVDIPSPVVATQNLTPLLSTTTNANATVNTSSTTDKVLKTATSTKISKIATVSENNCGSINMSHFLVKNGAGLTSSEKLSLACMDNALTLCKAERLGIGDLTMIVNGKIGSTCSITNVVKSTPGIISLGTGTKTCKVPSDFLVKSRTELSGSGTLLAIQQGFVFLVATLSIGDGNIKNTTTGEVVNMDCK